MTVSQDPFTYGYLAYIYLFLIYSDCNSVSVLVGFLPQMRIYETFLFDSCYVIMYR